jgi:hypothetical protein
MGEERCFVCRQGFGRRGRWKVRVWMSEELYADALICRICLGVLRQAGEIAFSRDGARFVVRELHPPEPAP